MNWQVVPDTEVPKVIEAVQSGRCVACYGPISKDCPAEHECYCCACDDATCSLLLRLAEAFQQLNDAAYAADVLAAMYRDGTDGYGNEMHVSDDDVPGIFRAALEQVAGVLGSEVWADLLEAAPRRLT